MEEIRVLNIGQVVENRHMMSIVRPPDMDTDKCDVIQIVRIMSKISANEFKSVKNQNR
jgi:hypothetical protein